LEYEFTKIVSESPRSPKCWPRISIVTPSYNQGKYIERTVRSVLFQRYPNLDYIVMDGGSTDDTMSRLAPYKDQFSFLISQPDNGQANAIAQGFGRSSGEIMAYLNSDDLLAPCTLHFVANFFESNPSVDCIYSHRCTIDENDKVTWYWILPPHHSSLMKRWDFIPQETCFWRRSLFEKAGNIDPSYYFAMDYDLFVRFMNLGRIRRVNRFMGAFRQHSESKTARLLEIVGRREMLRVRQRYGIGRLPHDGLLGMWLSRWVSQAGNRFGVSGRSLPGAFPGVGYDYNDFWGGVLRCSNQCGQIQTTQPKKSPYEPVCPVTLCFPDRLLFSITSARNGGALTSDVYLKESVRTAIILPSLGEYGRKGKSKIWDDQVTGIPETSEDPGLPRQSAAEILGFSRGLIADSDEIAFLEVNCHRGELLDELKARAKWKIFGLEANPSAAQEAISKGHQVYEANVAIASGLSEIRKCFDVIYLRHGIERFDEPRVSLRQVALLLNPGGFLILSTPNLDSEQLKRLGPAWSYWKPEEHRFIYGKKSLRRILALSGFVLTKLRTVSSPDSTRVAHMGGAPAPASREPAHLRNEYRAGSLTQTAQLLRNKFRQGDVIFAISRRIS
jgi:glycosyltransferase involved in cell wall biosynthesis/SAM-dependent methyltransferase